MTLYVVDASVAAKWFFEEVYSDEAFRLLENRHRLHAPDFLLLEVENLVCKRIRRSEISMAQGDKIRAALRQVPIQTHSFLALLDLAFQLANQTGRSLYDCLYVALAVLLDGQMATADRRLNEALANGPLAKHIRWVEDIASDE